MKLMTTPAQTPRGIAAQLEYALEDQLVGGAFGLEFSGLDDAMFRQMQQTLSALS
jgi:Leu/Phe-tRNA-protein transferase